MSLRRIAWGTATIGLINVMRLIVQTASVPLLARILSPDDYGLAAMAMPFVLFLMMLADAGLGTSLVRAEPRDGRAWHTCFWLSAGLGVTAGLAVAAVAPAAAFLLAQPRLTGVLLALAAVVPLQTLTLVPGAALQQSGRFRAIAAVEVSAMISGVAAAVSMAVSGFGVWALVGQQVVFYVTRLVLTLAWSPYRLRRIFDLAGAREHVVFGRNLLGVSLVSFASRSAENLAIGRVFGAGPVGVYAMAFQLARLPFMLVTGPLQYVLYPHVAVIRGDAAELRRLFSRLTRVLAAACLPGVALAAAASWPLVRILLSAKWVEAASLLVLVAPAAAVQPVTAIAGTFVTAIGRTDVQLRLSVQFAVLWVAVLSVTVGHGLEAVAGAYTVCASAFTLWSMNRILPLIGVGIAEYVGCFVVPAVATAAALSAYWWAALAMPAGDWIRAGVAGGLAIVAVGLSLADAWRRGDFSDTQTADRQQRLSD